MSYILIVLQFSLEFWHPTTELVIVYGIVTFIRYEIGVGGNGIIVMGLYLDVFGLCLLKYLKYTFLGFEEQ